MKCPLLHSAALLALLSTGIPALAQEAKLPERSVPAPSDSQRAPVNTDAPQEWTRVENFAFSFSVPKSFQNMNERGVDSFAEAYVAQGIVFGFDYTRPSDNSWDFYGWPAETTFEYLEISGKQARIGMAKRQEHPDYPYSAQAHIHTALASLKVFATCKSEEEVALFKMIVKTISFKESKSSP